jgi:muramoyltetrapeptide carboxypeptidase
MAACFDDLLLGQGEGTGWRLSAERGAGAAVADPALDRLRTRAVHGATLWGGNLSMLVSLLGTPWWPEVRGGVLFLEDVNEHPFRIERMLTQLLHAGVLGRQKALLLGSFTQYRLTPADRGFSMKTVVQRLRSLVDIPVLTGLPFGHVPTKVLLPVGAKVDLALDGRDALLVWGHV